MNATLAILTIFSPLLVALIRRCSWRKELVDVLAAFVILVLVVVGYALDNRLSYPMPAEFWRDLLGAFGLQQVAYKLAWRNTSTVEALENVGNKPVPAADPNAHLWK